MASYELLGPEWCEAVKEAVNSGPPPEERSAKLESYWQWVERAGKDFTGSLALEVSGLPEGPSRYVELTFENGTCTAVRPVSRDEAQQATFLLSIPYQVWPDLIAGYDMGKAVMYRKIRMLSGELLAFYNRVFYFIEVLSSVRRVPAQLPT